MIGEDRPSIDASVVFATLDTILADDCATITAVSAIDEVAVANDLNNDFDAMVGIPFNWGRKLLFQVAHKEPLQRYIYANVQI